MSDVCTTTTGWTVRCDHVGCEVTSTAPTHSLDDLERAGWHIGSEIDSSGLTATDPDLCPEHNRLAAVRSSPDEIDEVGTLKDGRRIHVKGKAWDAIVRERGWSAALAEERARVLAPVLALAEELETEDAIFGFAAAERIRRAAEDS